MIEIDVREMSHYLRSFLAEANADVYEEFEQFYETAALSFHEFPRDIRKAVHHFVQSGDPDGVLLIRNLPTDVELPPTPSTSHTKALKVTQASEFWLYCIASILHARSKFTAYYDGRDRWLQRMLVVEDLSRSSSDRACNSRVICSDFSRFLCS